MSGDYKTLRAYDMMSEEERAAVIKRMDAAWARLSKPTPTEEERLRAALERISTGDVPRTHVIIYRDDGEHSKHDRCPHGRRMYEDCDECVSEFARSVLDAEQ